MAVQIPFPLPSHGYALNSKMRVNLDFLVTTFNQFNTGAATWDTVGIGVANNETGTLTFYNSSNANYLTFQAGATGANLTFTLPTAYAGGNGAFLKSTTAGVMSWSTLRDFSGAITGNQLLYTDGVGVLQEVAVGTGNKVLVNSSPPSFFSLLGTTNQITVTPNVGNFTLSLPQDIATSSSVQFSRVKVDAGTYSLPGFYFASSTANTVGLFAEGDGSGLDVRVGGSSDSTVFTIGQTGLAVATLELRAPTIRATTAFKISTSTGSIVTIQALTSAFGAYTLTLPPNDGNSNDVLTTDGSGVMTWTSVSSAGGATKALDNLASVAINTSLLPGADNSIDLGSSSKDWRSVYFSTSLKSGSTTLATATEVGYLTGVTSAIQTQIDGKSAVAGNSSLVTVGTVTSGTWSATTIAVNKGGTGQTSYTDGQLLIGNTTGNTLAKATLTGTSNQVVVTNGSGTITLSTPQSIDTAATPTFGSLTLSAGTNQLVLGTTRTITITAPIPATSSRTVSVPDPGTNANFVLSEADATVNGVKTYGNNAIFNSDVYTVAYTDYSGTSTIVGWSGFNSKKIEYKKIGKVVFVWFQIDGTSNATNTTFTLPYAKANDTELWAPIRAFDNGADQANPGLAEIDPNSATVNCFKTWASGVWTNSGRKIVTGTIVYHTA